MRGLNFICALQFSCPPVFMYTISIDDHCPLDKNHENWCFCLNYHIRFNANAIIVCMYVTHIAISIVLFSFNYRHIGQIVQFLWKDMCKGVSNCHTLKLLALFVISKLLTTANFAILKGHHRTRAIKLIENVLIIYDSRKKNSLCPQWQMMNMKNYE